MQHLPLKKRRHEKKKTHVLETFSGFRLDARPILERKPLAALVRHPAEARVGIGGTGETGRGAAGDVVEVVAGEAL